MHSRRQILRSDGGWTLIEAVLTIVIMAIMVLGLTIVLLAFKEHLDRSWAIRTMDQYGNDVVEKLTHDLRNAMDVTVRHETSRTDRITVEYLDPWKKGLTHKSFWFADLRSGQIKVDYKALDPTYPPRRTRRGEVFEIHKFKLIRYGLGSSDEISDEKERSDSFFRNKGFLNATYDIVITLRYTRGAINPGDRNWSFEKRYENRVYMRNKNLAVKDAAAG